MTPLEQQVTTLLGLTGTLNVLDAIEHVKTVKHLLHTTEQQRKEWADMCIRKQARIEHLEEMERYLTEMMDEYKSDYISLNECASKVLTMTDDEKVKHFIHDTIIHLCANMK